MDDIRAAWAEAVHIWKEQKPALVLPDYCKQEAEDLQNQSMADDGMAGIIEEYLKDKQRVCTLEVWQEALGEQGRPPKWQATVINDIINGMPEWEKMKNNSTFGKYGKQRGFLKKSTMVSTTAESYQHSFRPLTDAEKQGLPFT